MLMEAKNQIKVQLITIKYALQREMLNKVTFFSNVIFMLLNNASFLIQWIVLYSIKDNVGGYQFKEVILLWGIAAGTYGISHFFFKDVFDLTDMINTGKLDNYLIQPKNILISSITSSIEVSALGDIIYGYIMLFIYGITIKNFILYTILTITGGLILVSLAVLVSSLSFWFGRVEIFASSTNNMMTSFATYPDGIFKGFIKLLFFTIIPLEFSSYLPIKLIINFNPITFIIIILATVLFITLSFIVFYKGLERYSSSNLMNTRT